MKIIKKLLLLIGFVVTIGCLFLPLHTTCEGDAYEEFIQVEVLGKDNFIYYLSFFFLIPILFIGFFKQNSTAKLLILILIGGVVTLFYNWIGQGGFGKPCGHTPTQFLYLLYLGHVMLVVSSLLHANLKKNKQNN